MGWTIENQSFLLRFIGLCRVLAVRNPISVPVWGCVFVCKPMGLSTTFILAIGFGLTLSLLYEAAVPGVGT